MLVHGYKVPRRLEILSKDELYAVHQATLGVLEKTGASVYSEDALKLFDRAGATVDYKHKNVKLPRNLVEEAIKKAPGSFTQRYLRSRYGLKSEVIIGGDETHASLGTSCTYVLDFETGERRGATKRDAANFARILDAQNNFTMHDTMVVPQDVPPEVAEIHRLDAILRNASKPFVATPGLRLGITPTFVGRKEIHKHLLKMLAAVVGGEEELMKHPPAFIVSGGVVSGYFCPSSPIKWEKDIVELLMEYVKWGFPAMIMTCPGGGASTPVTLAGDLVVANAENLTGIVLAQLVNKGNPVVYAMGANIMDLKTGIMAHGAPEAALLWVAAIQLAQYYGLPSTVPGLKTDSKQPDEQAGYEKAMTTLLELLAAPSIINFAGPLEDGILACYEQPVIDNDILGAMLRITRGIEVNPDTLAVDLIHRVIESGGNFMTEKHTFKYMRSERWYPSLTDRLPYPSWKKQGAKDMRERAREKTKEILDTYYLEPLDPDVERELNRLVKKAEKDLLRKAS